MALSRFKVFSLPIRHFLQRTFSSYIPPPTSIKDVSTFLGTIKRGCEVYANKFPNWESLFTMKSEAMEKAGIPCKPRKMILRWVHKYRLGIEPYYIRPSQKSRKKAKLKRKAAANTTAGGRK